MSECVYFFFCINEMERKRETERQKDRDRQRETEDGLIRRRYHPGYDGYTVSMATICHDEGTLMTKLSTSPMCTQLL